MPCGPPTSRRPLGPASLAPALLVSLGFTSILLRGTWVPCVDRGPHARSGLGGSLTLSWLLGTEQRSTPPDCRGLHWASLGWAGPGAR